MDIVFMGSSQFAVAAFFQLNEHNKFRIKAVYTKPPKPAGRGMSVQKTPVHIAAQECGLQVATPKTLKGAIIPECDVIVVVSYGLILPKEAINHPKIAAINIHPSLLPRWRGAAPMQHTILSGDTHSGVSIVQMTEELDAGDIFLQRSTPVGMEETYSQLHYRLSLLGSKMLIEVLENINQITPFPQKKEGLTYANKLPNSIEADWMQDAQQIIRQINVFGGVFTEIFGIKLKITKALLVSHTCDNQKIGQVMNHGTELYIKCKNGLIAPQIVHPIGKKQMNIKSFLNGIKK